MTNTFVPFLQAAKTNSRGVGNESFAVLPSPGADEKTAILLHEPIHSPRVEVKKDGEVITEIRVFCSCGQVIQLKCEY